MKLNKIYNVDCRKLLHKMIKENKKVDVILTSPPYNISKHSRNKRTVNNHETKYLEYNDHKTNKEYSSFIINCFKLFTRVLKPNGVILCNLSYASSMSANNNCTEMLSMVYKITEETNLMISDIICWKKSSAIPDNRSVNKLTRLCEYIFVFCKKSEYSSFYMNKSLVKRNEAKNLNFYETIYNYIEAKNNDGSCKYNKATYSSELCEKLLNMYAPLHKEYKCVVLDPFMGTGTTAVACKKLGISFIGSELSKDQVQYAFERIKKLKNPCYGCEYGCIDEDKLQCKEYIKWLKENE